MLDNTILVSLSRQVALRRQMDVIANNLANLQTVGFKSSGMLFEEHMMRGAEATAAMRQDRDVSFVMDRGTLTDFSSGPLRQTGNPLDVAIDGEGWFAVETPSGTRYTRNGGFMLDATGQLVTAEGHRVLGDGGAIAFDDTDGAISFAADGTISTETGDKGRLRVVTFAADVEMTAEGAGLFAASGPASDLDNARVHQGMLEGSNVKPIVEMSRMIEVTRAYTSLSSILENIADMRRNAIGVLAVIE